MKRKYAIAIVSSVLFISGCATIVHGSTQSVAISSVPSNATVSIDGVESGVTPLDSALERKTEHTVSISLPGYVTQDLTLTKSTSGWVWGNIIFGGLIGLIVDASTGSLYKLTPEQLTAELAQGPAAQSLHGNDSLHVRVVLQANSEWQKIGMLQLGSL